MKSQIKLFNATSVIEDLLVSEVEVKKASWREHMEKEREVWRRREAEMLDVRTRIEQEKRELEDANWRLQRSGEELEREKDAEFLKL